jgi:thiol-disulfide isomerase/thioredoxin
VTLCALALGVSACGLFGHDDATVSPVPSSPAIVVATGSIPDTVGALPTLDVAGFHTLLEQAKGTPLVVNFWASWCGPCVDEAPLLAKAARTHRGIQFLGVDILDDRGDAQQFIRDHAIPYPSVFDPPGDIRTDAGSEGQPVTLFIAADGLQVAKVDGQLDAESLQHNLSLLAN